MYGNLQKLAAAASAAAVMLTGTAAAVRTGAAADTAEPLRLMCLGDSITDGFWMPGGYRNTLCRLISENGMEQQIDMVGPQWGGDGYDPQHAGYSGYSIEDIPNQRVGIRNFSEWLMEEYPADVIFLEIGTNDILSQFELEHFGDRLNVLLDILLAHIPADGMLYLATLPVMNADVTTYIDISQEKMDECIDLCNAQIRTIAAERLAAGQPVQLAEINKLLTFDDLVDGVHPNEQGYKKMGEFWFRNLNAYLSGETEQPALAETTAPASERPLSGDVDGNGLVQTADAVMLAKHLCTAQTLSAEQAKRGDMNRDGIITATDLSMIKREAIKTTAVSRS
ncbi:MAG: hypothetical protein IKQ91_06640 [Oscillospiraceae bacterium]|nr:hypothetical protein [Oscillospiraceae bacterium]